MGDLGHFLLLTAFVSVFLALIGFFLHNLHGERRWWYYACAMCGLHVLTLCSAAALLSYLLLSDHFAYHYVWSHSMLSLPTSYKVAAFWEGQEGSFLLWMLWQMILGGWVMYKRGALRNEVLAVLCLIQLCLASMLLGVVVGDWKVGSSPFLLLREVIKAPIFTTTPDFIPVDGTGLSPLLQNYWMVIHPPVLFMGFACVGVPFAYVCAGLWKKEVDVALRRAFPWVGLSVLVLGTGIVLGAIWAYETLNFGGYWNWDPVENAVYVPWLALVAALHMLILYVRREKALRGSLYTIFAAFVLVLYATFLVRSGILGNTSVHAFTDAGLSGQLIGFMLLMSILFFGLLYIRRKELPHHKPFTYTPYRVDMYLAAGITCLLLMAFQVLVTTSLPVWNAILTLLGMPANWAPPTDPVAFYSKIQLYFAICLLVLSGVGQLLFWRKASNKPALLRVLCGPLFPALLAASCVILLVGMQQLSWIWLLSAGLYALAANGYILYRLLRFQPAQCAGALSHTGIACIVLGILFSSGYSRIVSTNNTGFVWHRDFPSEINTQDILLFQYQKRYMQGYTLEYTGTRKRIHGTDMYIPTTYVESLSNPQYLRAKKPITSPTHLVAKQGDTLHLKNPDKTYFEIIYQASGGDKQFIYPSAQRSPQDGSILYAPYILHSPFRDIYTHVRTFSTPEDVQWSEPQKISTAPLAKFFANDYVARILGVTRLTQLDEVALDTGDIALAAHVELLGPDGKHYLRPILVIKDQEIGLITDESLELGIHMSFMGIYPADNCLELEVRTTQAPWVILEVIEKPLINLLWGGCCILGIGLLLSFIQHTRKRYT